MSDITTISATQRERVGKGSARAARRAGAVPAVIYGDRRNLWASYLKPVRLPKSFTSRVFSAAFLTSLSTARKTRF